MREEGERERDEGRERERDEGREKIGRWRMERDGRR